MGLPTIEPITEGDLAFLRGVDSPTVANAVEPFGVRDRTEGFIGGNVRALFPDLPPTVGYALTVTMNDEPGPVKGREGFWAMFEALARVPAPSVVVVQDTSGHPERVAFCGEVMATMAQRLGAVGYVTDGTVRDVHEVRALGGPTSSEEEALTPLVEDTRTRVARTFFFRNLAPEMLLTPGQPQFSAVPGRRLRQPSQDLSLEPSFVRFK